MTTQNSEIKQKFIDLIMRRLESYFEIPRKDDEELAFDKNMTLIAIADMFEKNWSIMDALNYCRCINEVNPLIDEDIALKRMYEISSKYEKKQ